MKDKVIKNGLIGTLGEVYSYCNEKDNPKGFLFLCNEECKHNKT